VEVQPINFSVLWKKKSQAPLGSKACGGLTDKRIYTLISHINAYRALTDLLTDSRLRRADFQKGQGTLIEFF